MVCIVLSIEYVLEKDTNSARLLVQYTDKNVFSELTNFHFVGASHDFNSRHISHHNLSPVTRISDEIPVSVRYFFSCMHTSCFY